MKYVLRALEILLIGLVLAGCSSGFEGGELETQKWSKFTLEGKVWVSNTNLKFGPPKDNCVSSDVYSKEQGQAKTFSGGLTYEPSPFVATTTPRTIGEGLKASFFATFNPIVDTEILIIDDFGAGQYELPNFQNYTNVDRLLESGEYTHGALVMYHANEVIKGSNLYDSVTQSSNGQTIYTKNGKTLKVRAVNTQLASQANVFHNISVHVITTKRLVAVGLPHKLSSSKVFNMSFGIVPCEVYADFKLSNLTTFRQYIERFVVKNYKVSDTKINNKIDTPRETEVLKGIIEITNLPDDPLKKLIANSVARHIFVAAAGNDGLDISMYPANWPGVINVTGSSVEDRNNRLVAEFNKGEVMTVGSLFKITSTNDNDLSNDFYYYGTSFATPSVSAYSALDLAGKQRCTDSNNQNLKSELALDPPTLRDLRLENTNKRVVVGPFNQSITVPVLGAVQTRCGTN